MIVRTCMLWHLEGGENKECSLLIVTIHSSKLQHQLWMLSVGFNSSLLCTVKLPPTGSYRFIDAALRCPAVSAVQGNTIEWCSNESKNLEMSQHYTTSSSLI